MDNPYIAEILSIIAEWKGWLMALDAGVTIIMIVYYAFKYKIGTSTEKQDCIIKGRNTLFIGGGIFFLVWLAGSVIDRMKNVRGSNIIDQANMIMAYIKVMASV